MSITWLKRTTTTSLASLLTCRMPQSADAGLATFHWIWPNTSGQTGEQVFQKQVNSISPKQIQQSIWITNQNNLVHIPLQDPSVQSRETSAGIPVLMKHQSLLLCRAHETGLQFHDDCAWRWQNVPWWGLLRLHCKPLMPTWSYHHRLFHLTMPFGNQWARIYKIITKHNGKLQYA